MVNKCVNYCQDYSGLNPLACGSFQVFIEPNKGVHEATSDGLQGVVSLGILLRNLEEHKSFVRDQDLWSVLVPGLGCYIGKKKDFPCCSQERLSRIKIQ